MKKFGIAMLSFAILLGACKKEDDAQVADTYPTDGLKVSSQQKVLLIETTGAWCQFCPNGAVKMTEMLATYGDAILPMAVHSGDPLTAAISGILDVNFPTSGVPNFYVMSEDAGQAPQGKIPTYLTQTPVFGVTHAVVATDTSWNIYPKVEVFATSFSEDYLINSYIILDAVLAKDYGGGNDLNQVSSVPVAGGINPTKWLQDAAIVNGVAQIKAGTDYYHTEAVVGVAKTTNPYGKAIADVNPFGTEYIEGDILGTKNTPIMLSIPKMSIAPYQTGISIYTIVWRLRTDGSGAFDFVNGYMTHHIAN